MKLFSCYGLAGLVALGLLASNVAQANVAAQPAQLIVEDAAQFFTPAKIEEAKAIIAKSMGQGSRQVHIETFKSLTAEELQSFQAAADKKKFWHDWALSKTKGDRGISIFIVNDPPRYEVLVDRQMHNQGFDDAKENELKSLIKKHLELSVKAETPDAKQVERDATLISVANYLESTLPSTTKTAGHKETAKKEDAKKEGSNLGSYICIGVIALLGVWLVIGLIRAFKGGGAGGAGGGGFGTALLGGLFGAMAGMWIYNSFMGGGHDSSAFGGEGGDSGGGEAGGAGDYGGDQGSGGDYGGGDFGGGGDW